MRAGIFGSARVASTPAGPVTATFQTSAGNAADLTAYTFTAQPIGTASGSRRVVVAVAARNASAVVSTLTIGGVSATRDANTNASAQFSEIWSAVVPSGTTGDVVVTMSVLAAYCGIGVWSLTGGSPTGQTASAPTNNATQSMSVTTSVGDIVIGVTAFRAGSVGPKVTWNAANEQYDIDVDGSIRMHAGADMTAVGSSTDMGLVISSFNSDAASCAAAYA